MKNYKFTSSYSNIYKEASDMAHTRHHQYIEPIHLLRAIFDQRNEDDTVVQNALQNIGIDTDTITKELDNELDQIAAVEGNGITYGNQSRDFKDIVDKSSSEAKKFGDDYIGLDSLWLAMFKKPELEITKFVNQKLNIYYDKMRSAILDVRNGAKILSANSVRGKSILDKYAREMVAAAKKGDQDPIIGRDEETRKVIEILLRKNKNNPILIGEPGVGKTAIVQGLAQKIAKNDVPDELKGVKLYNLDLTTLVSNSGARGAFEGRIDAVIKEVEKSEGKIILFIDEIHTIVGAGNQKGAMDASNIIKPALARGRLHLIGATTIAEYKASIEKDGALARRFAKVQVNEPSTEQAIAMLRGLRNRFESFHGVTFHDAALVEAVKMSERYIAERFLPDKAIELVDSAGSAVKLDTTSTPPELDNDEKLLFTWKTKATSLEREDNPNDDKEVEKLKIKIGAIKEKITDEKKEWDQQKEVLKNLKSLREKVKIKVNQLNAVEEGSMKYLQLQEEISELKAKIRVEHEKLKGIDDTVTPSVIDKIVANNTGINVTQLQEGEKAKLLRLPETLHKRVIGQDTAIDEISNSIRRNRTGLSSPNRPIASYFYCGSTGVGKTELSKALAATLFDTEQALIRIDMSEYQAKENVNRLIGSPPGYVGYEEGGQLTEAVRAHPYSVVLFDEVEKAHPDILNVLLQVLDDGRLTDGKGRTISFKNTIVILTSNLGADTILNGWPDLSKPIPESTKKIVMQILGQHFRPEFINRLDDVVIFKPISPDDQRKIAILYLKSVAKRLREAHRSKMHISKKALTWIATDSYNPAMGARPLRRYIQDHVENLLSDAILRDQLKDNSEVGIIRKSRKNGYGDTVHYLDLGDISQEDHDPLVVTM